MSSCSSHCRNNASCLGKRAGYSGELFPDWRGDGFIGGLSSQSLVRIDLNGGKNGDKTVKAERFNMGRRIREIEQGPDGAIWILEDKSGGRLLKITPAS